MFYSSWGLNFNTFTMMNPFSYGSLRMYCPADRFVMPDSYFGSVNPFMFNSPMFNPYMMRFNMMQSIFNNVFGNMFNHGCNCRHNNVQTVQTLQPFNRSTVQPIQNSVPKYSLESRFTMFGDNAENIFNTTYEASSKNIFARKSSNVNKTSKSNNANKSKNKTIQISNKKIASIVHEKAQKYGVDENLILAMISQESSFTNGQTSSKGAKGLMQLMPATARELGVTDVNDPEQNIDAGVRYMKQLLDRYKGNVKLALAAYNAGMGNVQKYGGIPPFKETQNYVSKIYKNYKNASLS